MKIGGGGYVTGIVIHPSNKDIMYIRTDIGGAYRWNKPIFGWEQMLNWVSPENANLIGVDGIALDPNNINRVYLALGRRRDGEGGIFRTDTRKNGLWRSTDDGKTWVKIHNDHYQFPAGVSAIDRDKNVFGRIYVGSNDFGISYGEPVVNM